MPESGFLQFKRLIDDIDKTDHPSPALINDYAFFTELVESATQFEPEAWYMTDIASCKRRLADMQPCELQSRLSEKPDKIRWECKKCRMSGVITHFEESIFDSRYASGNNLNFSQPEMKTLMEDSALVEIRMTKKAFSVLKEVLETGQPDSSDVLDNLARFTNNEVNLTLSIPLAIMMLHSLELYHKKIGKHKSIIEMLLILIEQESMKAHIGVIAGYLKGETTPSVVTRILGLQDHKDMDELVDLRFALQQLADEENISFNQKVEQYVADQIKGIPDQIQKNTGGLSSMQITFMNMQTDWMSDTGGIRLNYAALEPHTVRSLPFMMNVQIFYRHLLESGGKVPMGRDGLFLPETVRYLVYNGVWPEYSDEWRYKKRNPTGAGNTTGKPFTDRSTRGRQAAVQARLDPHIPDSTLDDQPDDFNNYIFPFIEELAGVLLLSGLFTIKKGKCIPVRDKAEYLLTRNSPKLYALLLQTLYLEYNMAYRFGDEFIGELIELAQDNVAYALYQLHRVNGRQMMSSGKLTSRLLHPDLLNTGRDNDTPEKAEILRRILELICFNQYLVPFSRFGLVEMIFGDPSSFSFTFKARKTPLFDSLIQFRL